jgi:hypothetical protein
MTAGGSEAVYEERITIWPAGDFDEAIRLAEAEAAEYAEDLDAEYLGLAQGYATDDVPGAGSEVFSLVRTSSYEATEYLSTYFATGTERQADTDSAPKTD